VSTTRGDLEWGTIPRLVEVSAARFGEREALVDGDTRLTFSQLHEAAATAVRAAMAAGIEPGDRAAIWAPNMHEWALAALGVVGAGGVLVPINTRFKGQEAGYVLAKSGARALFTVSGFLDLDYVGMLASAGVDLPALRRVVVLRGDAPAGTVAWGDHLAGGDRVEPGEAAKRAESVGGGDLSDIIFTSGTTGRPKGVTATHAQSLRVFADWSAIVGLVEGDRYLVVNPFFHTFGYKAGFLAAVMRGATTLPQAVFDVDAVLARVAEEGVTMLPGPPTLYHAILDHPRRREYDLSSLRLAVTGAAAVPVELVRRMREELTFRTVITAYGLTEATGTVSACRPEDDPETLASTSGRAIPDVEVKVVDDRGGELHRGQAGEIVVRGYNVTGGYFEDPEETARTIDADGWLHTGDIGTMDERGYLRITDRKKDMFIVGGFNAYPAEIESALICHPSVAQAAVVGVPDDRLGEVGVAYVTSRPGCTVDGAELISWSRERMANYKVPRRVEVVDALPLNASGKVLKYELRQRAGRGS
jgi:acyl-CoA synthetase (AMP-forming)/AMP-acid ligase II